METSGISPIRRISKEVDDVSEAARTGNILELLLTWTRALTPTGKLQNATSRLGKRRAKYGDCIAMLPSNQPIDHQAHECTALEMWHTGKRIGSSHLPFAMLPG
jgi:hypothetical protein